ncbi:Pantoate-beta-alanine ligase [Gigaspora margarita]|uniref:Pantoate--beta-alanine ligase n=1 Tax=Gigaspora margarita TaxID=4874 RepID=A0A8H4AVS4_GIGMA|nr:Pantoate-beta-alanine ligase [Gigaspora margarita]
MKGSILKNMQIFENIHPLRNWRRLMVREEKLIGFVPTMGSLHEGHLSLIKQANKLCKAVAVSIFVNPAQFAPNEDLDKYPRSLSDDLAKLSAINCVDAVFLPKVEDIYPAGITLDVEKQLGTFVEVKGKSHQMEGQSRPTFFRGVATVVTKLFNIVQPDHVFFGQKDIQQCAVIKNLIRDLHFPLELHVGPTLREEDGLAMSSRNKYLTPEMRKVAAILYQSLNAVKHAFEQNIRDRKNLLAPAYDLIENKSKFIKDQNLDFSIKLDYLSLADPESLQELDEVGENGAILSGALYIGTTRILDNLLLNCKI